MAGGFDPPPTRPAGPPLEAYLLGTLGFDDLLPLQARLGYELGDGGNPAVLLCDHPAGLTVGREGSRSHVRLSPEELAAREWGVRWVARGGGVMLHLPGQVACYPVLPLADLGLTPAAYVAALTDIGVELTASFDLPATADAATPGVRVAGRRLAHVGVAVRGGATGFGLLVNVAPDLELFRGVECDGDPRPMTSLQRECPTRVRPQAVRQRLLDLLAARFGFDRVSVFHHHPTFLPKPARHALAHRHR